LQGIDTGGVDGFGAPDARFVTEPGIGADAEFGDADDGFVQAEGIEQLGLGGYQGDDPAGSAGQKKGSAQLIGESRHAGRYGF
jgi:hypothetical protein